MDFVGRCMDIHLGLLVLFTHVICYLMLLIIIMTIWLT
jgi:hypothetical protein